MPQRRSTQQASGDVQVALVTDFRAIFGFRSVFHPHLGPPPPIEAVGVQLYTTYAEHRACVAQGIQ